MLTGLLVVVIVLAVLLVGLYNRLVSLRVRAENAWSDIDVQLKRRADLVPNLVSTVQGYAAHERQTLDAVTQARTRAVAAQSAGHLPLRALDPNDVGQRKMGADVDVRDH